ncbi:LINE-1 retrotransposable element ORF2 protein [Arachis hypogaea]|nr:LINE-1 retrotransposable element ORF2 protein [Arachis hypogaea]
MIRRRRNRVLALQNDDGIWVTKKNDLEQLAFSFFSNLYQDTSDNPPYVLKNEFLTFNTTELNILGGEVMQQEIKDTLFVIGSLKALSRDGIQAIFYQQYWNKVGPDLCRLIQTVFHNLKHVSELNETLITLIPKVDSVSNLKQMRSISLCNVSYKIVTKILASRMRRIMEKLEVIHSMRNKKGRQGWMAIKIDLEKAYDKLKWSFVEDTLKDIGLPSNTIELILSCISSARMRVLWNGEELEEFKPTRGIRQGDPISPYIFVLCIERLSQLINCAVNHGFWKPIRIKRRGPALSHLCFADDLILFAEANMNQASVIKRCLNTFCESSGQTVSQEKTRIFFSSNVGGPIREEISDALGFARTDNLRKYLGVPLHHNKVSGSTFDDIISKLNTRLNSWKVSSLSLAGRNTLVKSVISSILSYTMQTALIPSTTCNAIDHKCRNFLWGETAQSKKIHRLSWKKIGEHKNNGGLGIRHARTLNRAFMMKVGWGLIEKKDALWARVLRSKYGGGDWDIKRIKEWLPDDIVKKINALIPPSPWKEKD